MFRRKNGEMIIQIIILLLLDIYLFYLMMSGNINYYVHPRFHIGIWMSIIILIVFVMNLMIGLGKPRHNVNLKPYGLFIIPIIAALLIVTPGSGGREMVIASNKQSVNVSVENRNSTKDLGQQIEDTEDYNDNVNIDIVDFEYNQSDSNMVNESEIANSLTESEYGSDSFNLTQNNMNQTYLDMSDKYNSKIVDGITVIEEDNFASWYYDVYDYLDDFVGEKYQFLAQVYHLDELGENYFLAGRYIMVCCAADLTGYGLVCESNLTKDLKEDEWILVTGTIEEYDYKGTKVPMLKNVTITKTEPPKNEYVYYNFN